MKDNSGFISAVCVQCVVLQPSLCMATNFGSSCQLLPEFGLVKGLVCGHGGGAGPLGPPHRFCTTVLALCGVRRSTL